MKNKLYIIALSSLLLGATSCNDYLDINESPDRISVNDLTPNFVFPGAVTNSYYVQARRLNLFAGLMMNSVAGNSYSYGTPFVDEYSPNITSAFYADVWDQLFRNVANFQFVLDYSDPTGEYTQYKAMSKIMKAYYVQTLTDLWGDMPYSEAFKRELNLTPKYDKGEDIYKASIADIESAIQMIDSNKGANPGSSDVVFKGSMSSWKAFANTLKLRYLIRMSNVTGDLATYRDQKLATLQGATFNTADVTVNPGYSQSSDAQQNPWMNYYVYTSAGAQPQNWTLVVPSEHIAIALNGNAVHREGQATVPDTRNVYQKFNGIVDGRRGRIFTLVSTKDNNNVTTANVEGVRQGATPGQPGAPSLRTVSRTGDGLIVGSQTIGATDAAGRKAELIQKGSSKAGVLMTKAETEFLLAEAALRYPAQFSAAQAHFESGITASYAYLGASGATTYIASVNAVPKLGWTGTDTNKLEAIMTQKWIALTGINPEQSYFDYTRTSYPETPLPTISLKAVKPNRLLYPNSEYQSNANNVPSMAADDVFAKNKFTPFWARN
ncbi:SusD/RagB family nutrient-binding outer membrane lipoprotein [Chryseobacterium sp.]|uniref:SusD/RagB family nutrient-binding outer membrane lipoprotein n=1 Tax=Chryseobacterium sp. TaxID=1871047 RepID=UPI0035B10B60